MKSAGIDLDLVTIPRGGKYVRSDFLIGRHPVTVGEFRAILGGRAEWPAETAAKLATWHEAIRFCNLLSTKAGMPPAYDEASVLLDRSGIPTSDVAGVGGFRLPTGPEWDYAARGGRPDPPYADWGAVLDRIYWSDPTSHSAVPIAPKEPVTNAIGLTGMLGLVREWYSHSLSNGDRLPRVCGWSHHYTNYDCLIAYHVGNEIAEEGATYPFRIALSARP